ncbi:MAG: asparagine synthase (glutamine-hydrolyzing) [Burkholderiales bacterium]|nr:asparagine synthase (glutamine-hydrolyzing) [Burkholderiales bacterium]
MCGIAGILNRKDEPISPIAVKRMTDAIAHRGPDGQGLYIDGPIGLGHRRLAIIDLSPAAHQPMSTEDGRYVLSYNGEVYNFQELRIELEALGHQFKSRTDSEVVLKACAQWGEQALQRFNGMFAFALWDKAARRLLLARDRYGIKPLYYAWFGDTLLFASEIKAMRTHARFRAALDHEALVEYLTFQNFFTDRTLFEGVRLLPAAAYMWVDATSTSCPAPQRYWDFNFVEPEQSAPAEEYLEELDRLMRQAVSRQLVSDVDIGAYLSGGMDSGSVTALAAKELPYIKSFTCGFDLHSASGVEMGYDERVTAEFMSYKFKTEHYEMVLKAGDMERVMPRLTWHLEEPRVGQSYPNFYIAQLASKFVKVVLCGTGGDELFAGYPWRYYRAVVNDDFEHYVDKYYGFWQRIIPNGHLREVLTPIAPKVKHVWTRDIFRNVFARHAATLTRPEDYINHSLYLEAKTFLHGLLVVEDKLSMAHSLETRVPFLDNDLVDFAMKLPARHKLGNLTEIIQINENEPGSKTAKYFQKTRDGKLILRKAMERYVPAEITEREKQGFSAPDASWFKGESIEYVRRRLYSERARIYQLIDRDAVLSLVNEHLQGRQNRRLLIWSLLNLEYWLETFLP